MTDKAEEKVNSIIVSNERFSGIIKSGIKLSTIPSGAHKMEKFIHATCDIDIANISALDIASISGFIFKLLGEHAKSEVGYEILFRFPFEQHLVTVFKISLLSAAIDNLESVTFNNIFDRVPTEGVTTSLYLNNMSRCLAKASAVI